MLGLRKNWRKYEERRLLRELRRDPHMAKDIGLPPLAPEPKITRVLW
ncbi:hypothetical protein AIOL_001355 [Candidatus Rhodobacter oscarellae]|uniref:Uncharacterized protein n=1 Tax=Candidatus Rhodobacter oscarellae TaxID=1675527 RepID=A0A0J9E139_9RHOB|nr:hypothetical protein [Candidatus Rhodobacter lobularis]KMW56402.1 hypothetical protein AIOL_001355 [Candidatus Rhodobacter lobularis]